MICYRTTGDLSPTAKRKSKSIRTKLPYYCFWMYLDGGIHFTGGVAEHRIAKSPGL